MEFMEQINLELFNQFTKGCLRCYELRCHLKLVYLHISKFLSYYTVRYHRCYAPRYRLDKVYIYHQPRLPINPHCGFPFAASQLGKSYVRKKVMCGPHTSLRSSVASHPTLPSFVLHGHLDRQYFYNLGWRRLQQDQLVEDQQKEKGLPLGRPFSFS